METSLGCYVAMACHSIVILGRQDCPPAIWLRSLSKMALINVSTPIPYSSPMILIKTPKLYNKGRLLQGYDHKFVRMRRTGAIPHVKVGRRVVPAHFTQIFHISQEPMMPIQSLHQQTLSNAPIYTGRREDQRFPRKYLCSVTIGTKGPIEGQKFDPHEQKYWVYQSTSTNRICFSAIDCFVTFPYTYMTTSKNKIGGRVEK